MLGGTDIHEAMTFADVDWAVYQNLRMHETCRGKQGVLYTRRVDICRGKLDGLHLNKDKILVEERTSG